MDADELAHSIDNVEWLFPEDHVLDTPPKIIDRDQTWVGIVMGGVHHIPFSRFKSQFADLTEDDARAKGYIKGNYKKEQVFGLLYETEFHEGETAEQILERAAEDREFDGNDPYLRGTYLGVMAHLEEIDALIGRFAKGWKTKRLSRVSRAVLRLGTYELRFAKGVPPVVAINEAVELSKKFDDPRARAFVNGVLNAVKDAPADQTAPEEPAVEPSPVPETDVPDAE